MELEPAPDLIVMPGRDRSTVDEMATLLRLAGVDAAISAYSFWARDESDPDLTAEVSALARKSPAFVIAKSIGTLVTMLAQRDHGLELRAAFFVGVPVIRLRHEGRTDLLLDHCRRTPTSIVQRRGDPTGSFADLAQTVAGSAGATLRELAGDTHSYAEVEVAAVLRDWWHGLSPRA